MSEHPEITTLDEEIAAAKAAPSQNETPTEPIPLPTDSWKGTDPFIAVKDIEQSSEAAQRLQAADEARAAAEKAQSRQRLKTGVGLAATGAVLVGTTFAGVNAAQNHAENVVDDTRQHQEEFQQDQRREEFENGLSNNKVPIQVNDIPPVVQEGDIQLPTLPDTQE